MEKQLSAEDVAILIRARKIIKEKGLPKDIDVSGICGAAGKSPPARPVMSGRANWSRPMNRCRFFSGSLVS